MTDLRKAAEQALRQLQKDDVYLGHRSKTRADAMEALRQAIEQEEDAVAAEREACAKVCEEWLHGDWHNQGVVAAAMIRARGEK